MNSPRLDVAAVSALDQAHFVALLGGVFEHSPWVAERAWAARPFATTAQLHAAMVAAVMAAGPELQLALIGAHPELAGKEAVAGTLTADSRGEQSGAGLDRCSSQELSELRELNRRYRAAHGFPFVMAVKGYGRAEILAALRARVEQTTRTEFARCLQEIAKIGAWRLAVLVADD
ncbi:MAG: 2-oxo-4-hydroxy-4-carboxy-5-ureidoimidazoline decarboxylase [Rhodocyclaceae bacterium]|nr:2-oxo-4-hydroxy-4-carboxy-5-ureidoimidazoline decarboxylase [Rhodocyclaceae bacterium]MBX3669873.1 2-oxo-4-hydroxy-4-carboxy-5-ureidoimidazoline decarboxylase [Rhodocyclaceae bacterium]